MPRVQLSIDVNVENYQEIVRKQRGAFVAWFTRVVPFVRKIANKTIDSTIEETLASTVKAQLQGEIVNGLKNRGVEATVVVSSSIPST